MGGPAYTDPLRQVWSADFGYSDGNPYTATNSVSGTNAVPLYQSERWNPLPFQYQFALANGSHSRRWAELPRPWTAP